MKVSEFKGEIVGVRIWNVNKTNQGVIVSRNPDDDNYFHIIWDNAKPINLNGEVTLIASGDWAFSSKLEIVEIK